MNDVEEKILSYPQLPVEGRREIETYVESNPEWAPLLRDVRTLERLTADVQESLPSDALLATYVVAQYLHPGEVSSTLQSAFSQLEARIEEDEALRREVNAARRRLRDAEASIDPVSQFEELTGHVLDTESETEGVEAPETAAQSAEKSTPSIGTVLRSLPLLARRFAMAVVLLGVTYGGLYGVSVATQSPLDRLAAVNVSDQVIENYVGTETRNAISEPDTLSVDGRYLKALSALRAARTTTLGLFPRYDAGKLERSRRLLEQVLNRVDPGSFLASEAHFYLGKIALAQERTDAAQKHFKTVVKRQGRKREKAYEILKTLQQERLMQE
jgi:TolA-binding protein